MADVIRILNWSIDRLMASQEFKENFAYLIKLIENRFRPLY